MPTYVYECCTCHVRQEAYRPVSEHAEGPECCGSKTKQVIVPTNIAPDLTEYVSPVTRKLVRGRKQQRDELARSGCRIAEPSEKESFTKKRPDTDVSWQI